MMPLVRNAVHYFYQSSSDLSRVNRAALIRRRCHVMWGVVLVGAVPLLFPARQQPSHPLCYTLLLNNQQLHSPTLYHLPKQHPPHNTAIMPRQFFVGGNFKMYAAPTHRSLNSKQLTLTSPTGTAPLSRSPTLSTSSTTPRSTPTPRSSSPLPPSTSSSPASTPARASRLPPRTSSTSPTVPSPVRSPSPSSRTPTSPGPSSATASAASSSRRPTTSSPARPRPPLTAASA
jgi:hypothetical protein